MDRVAHDGDDSRAALQVLNAVDHGGLVLRTPDYAARHFVQVVPAEFGPAAAQHPLLLNKRHDTGRFYVGALFGFREGENLFLSDHGDFNGYRPLDCEREGFFVADGVIAIDPACGRFDRHGGEPLFDGAGEGGAALRRVQAVLGRMEKGLHDADRFVAAMLSAGLVEPIEIDLSFDDGERVSLAGLYTISLDALARLDDDAALDLFRSGYLQLAYTLHASLRQIPVLARRRNDRLSSDGRGN